jgi:predicted  nucleic acid-binding Zn-ribbon protein
MSPIKRKPSRSPEGSSHQRKALRNDSIATSNGNGNGSRKNSNANASIIDASADPRQNRGAPSNAIRSPVSTDGSTYQDAASSRSTPRLTSMKDGSAPAISHDEGNGNGAESDDAEMIPLLGPLAKLLALVRAESGVQVSQKLAKIQLETANSEHHNMKHNFQRFPSIEERLKKGKITADQEIAKLERQLTIQTKSQTGIAKSLATAFLQISSRAEKARRVNEVPPDAVSRQELRELQDRLDKQQGMLEKQSDLVNMQRQHIDALRNSHTEAQKNALQARQQANTTESEMIQDMTKLENQLQIIEASLRSDVDRVRKEIQPQLDKAIHNAADCARSAAEGQETAVTQIAERLGVQSKVLSQLSNTVEAATNTISSVQKGLVKLEERLTATKNEVGQIGANEQRAVSQRLEGYDQKLNDLRGSVKSLRSENARIQEDPAHNAQSVKDAPNPATSTYSENQAASTGINAFMAQVEKEFVVTENALADLRRELKDEAEAQAETLGGAQDAQDADLSRTNEQLASLAQKVEALEEQASTCSNGIQRLEQSSNDKHTHTRAAYDSMRDAVKTIQSNLEMLQAKTTSLSDNVAALERRPVPTAQMPAPAAQDAVHFRPVATQSPRAANSRSGSTSGQANGVQSPRNPASPLTPFGFSGGAPQTLPRDLAVLADQVRGMAGTVSNLKQRMDNLTTDEVHRGMVDQFSKMYPAAKDFQATVSALHATDAKLEASLNSTNGMMIGNQAELRRKFDELAERFVEGQERTSEVKEAVSELRKNVEVSMDQARSDFDTAMGLQTGVIIDVRHQVQALADNVFGPSGGP